MKRLAFACEILADPALIFCDEPTSGLDSYMAENVVSVLRLLAKEKKTTVVCTIHQPSSQVFHLFDRLLLMAEGRVAFFGSLEESKGFFSRIGFANPTDYNPADHYIQTLAVRPGKEAECKERVKKICDEFHKPALVRSDSHHEGRRWAPGGTVGVTPIVDFEVITHRKNFESLIGWGYSHKNFEIAPNISHRNKAKQLSMTCGEYEIQWIPLKKTTWAS